MKKLFFLLACALSAVAIQARTIFLDTGGSTLWNQYSAVFFVRSWSGTGSNVQDLKMTATYNADIFLVDVPDENEKIIFVRMPNGSTSLDWNKKWDQTADLTIPSDKDQYNITGWEMDEGFWSVSGALTITTITIKEQGSVSSPSKAFYLDEVELIAIPNYGYHFTQWSDGNKDNPRTIVITQDTTFTAEFVHNPIITYLYNSQMGVISGPTTTEAGIIADFVTFEAIPNYGYHFIRWADGITDNPRTIELTQDTTMEAFFDYILEGKCGKDSVLSWKLDPSTMALDITGKGALSENYTYGTFIESLTIGNEVTSIGQSAFYGFNNLNNIIIGSSVKVLEEVAFANCSSIETITCYSQRPPTVNNYALYGLDYSTIVYVPADYLETYKMHDSWGLYDVRPIEKQEAIEDVFIDANTEANKLLHNGQFLILRANHTYTLTGQQLK